MSDEQTLTSACTLVPNLAHNFPTGVSANLSAQYRVAFSFEMGVIERFGLSRGFVSTVFLNNSKSSSVKSSEPSMSRFDICLSHIFIRFNLSLLVVPGQ